MIIAEAHCLLQCKPTPLTIACLSLRPGDQCCVPSFPLLLLAASLIILDLDLFLVLVDLFLFVFLAFIALIGLGFFFWCIG